MAGETNTDGIQDPSHHMDMAGHVRTHEGTFPNFGRGEGRLETNQRGQVAPNGSSSCARFRGCRVLGAAQVVVLGVGCECWAGWAWWAWLDLVPKVMGH